MRKKRIGNEINNPRSKARNTEENLVKKAATIMVIDDDAGVHDVFQLLLARKYNVVCFYSGLDGFSYIKSNPVDLVFLDYAMPDLNGLEVARRIKKNNPVTPVVMITAHGSERVAAAALRAKIEDYIKKPFSEEEINKTITNFIPEKLDSIHRKLDIARRAIEADFSNSFFQLYSAAKAADLNINYLSWRFKQIYGMSPIRYLTKLRVDKAKRLLENTNLNISQVAQASGFNQTAYFCRVFHKTTGCQPKIYRSTHIKKTHLSN